jgi:hypothetical protein
MDNLINFSNICVLILILLVAGCEQEPPDPFKGDPKLPPIEALVAKDWQYRDLMINGDTLNVIAFNFEPLQAVIETLHIRFRWFRYATNKTYEFNSDVPGGPFSIGSIYENSLNYQPGFGYWKVNGDSLIHNEYDASYRTAYYIVHISDTLFIREYERIVQLTSEPIKWPLGDTVVYREVFVPRIK